MAITQYYTYFSSFGLRNHKDTIHLGIKRHKCKDCEFGTVSQSKLEDHINQVHLKIKPYKCNTCDKSFSRSSHLKGHIARVHAEKVKCDQCQKELKNELSLIGHIKHTHPNTNNLFQCDACDKTYTTMQSLTFHKKSVHEKKFYVKCDFCDLEICNGSALKVHIRNQHKGEIPKTRKRRKVECNLCHKIMRNLHGLYEHLTLVHKVKVYKCFQCKDLFTEVTDFNLHLLSAHAIHSPDKLNIDLELQSNSPGPKFECSICKGKFGSTAHLKMHFHSAHEDSKVNCEICGKNLLHFASLADHMRYVHHKRKRQHVCNICGKDYTKKSYYDKHVRITHNFNNQRFE